MSKVKEREKKKKMTDISILSSAPKFRTRDRKLSSRCGERVCGRLGLVTKRTSSRQ